MRAPCVHALISVPSCKVTSRLNLKSSNLEIWNECRWGHNQLCIVWLEFPCGPDHRSRPIYLHCTSLLRQPICRWLYTLLHFSNDLVIIMYSSVYIWNMHDCITKLVPPYMNLPRYSTLKAEWCIAKAWPMHHNAHGMHSMRTEKSMVNCKSEKMTFSNTVEWKMHSTRSWNRLTSTDKCAFIKKRTNIESDVLLEHQAVNKNISYNPLSNWSRFTL